MSMRILFMSFVFMATGILYAAQNVVIKVTANEADIEITEYDFKSANYQPFLKKSVTMEQVLLDKKFVEPRVMRLSVNDESQGRLFVDGPGLIHIEVSDDGKTKVSGCVGREKLDKFNNLVGEWQQKFEPLKVQAEALLDKGAFDEIKRVRAQADDMLIEFFAVMETALMDMGSSSAAFVALQYLDVYKQSDMFKMVLENNRSNYPNAGITTRLAEIIERASILAPGRRLDNITLANAAGKNVSLKDYKSKLVLVDFWASWCPNCRIEFPNLQALYKQYNDRGFEILGVTSKDSESAWRRILKQADMPWANVFDASGDVFDHLSITQLPANVLIDEQGIIIKSHLTTEELGRYLADKYDHIR